MKKLLLAACVMLVLVLIGCSEASSITSSSVGKVTGMHTTYPVGTALVIEIAPNKSAEADKYYIVEVSYLKKGRCRTAVSWTELEIELAKPKNVYVPLSQGEASTLYKEDESQLRKVFDVRIDSKPVDANTIKEFEKQGIITIYQ